MDDSSGMIAWAIECFQRGIIGLDDTGGLELNWGDPSLVTTLLEKIVWRKGFGDLLADGIQRACRKVARGSEKYAIHIKGLTTMDPLRTIIGTMLGEATSPRGGEHLRGAIGAADYRAIGEEGESLYGVASEPFGYEGKPELVVYFERLSAVANACNMCYFSSKWISPYLLDIKDYSELLSAATGWDLNEKRLVEIADRIVNVEKAFNVREGFTRRDDSLPTRFFKEPVPTGPRKGAYVEKEKFDDMLDKYYTLRGWDEKDGLQLEGTLRRLGLEEIISELKAEGKLVPQDK